MGHLTNLNPARIAALAAGNGWVNEDQFGHRELITGISYKKTRSTLALNASDLAGLEDNQVSETFEHLMRLCNIFGLAEIVIECLDACSVGDENPSVQDFFNSLQSDITRASRKINLYPPRIALEKRGEHFDLRIYPTFH